MKIITLTDEQAFILESYLSITANYRSDEAEACEKLSHELNEDGTPKFPNMKGNAEWWEQANRTIEEIKKAIENADDEKSATRGVGINGGETWCLQQQN